MLHVQLPEYTRGRYAVTCTDAAKGVLALFIENVGCDLGICYECHMTEAVIRTTVCGQSSHCAAKLKWHRINMKVDE